jgi:hypothetical protein
VIVELDAEGAAEHLVVPSQFGVVVHGLLRMSVPRNIMPS